MGNSKDNNIGDDKSKTGVSTGGSEGKKEIKLLLLGAGESGKSTFFKQMKILFDKGYNSDALKQNNHAIYANILTTIAVLAKSCQKYGLELANDDNKKGAAKVIELSKDSGLLISAADKYTQELHTHVGNLWKDPAIQKAFKTTRYEYHVFDGAEYFFSQLERLTPPDYEVTTEDILHCRRKTTGIVELNFEMDNVMFKLFDVGGQRNERKKWVHCFTEVSCVVFVVSMSDFDQKCYEDDIKNRMHESLELFDEIVNGNWFKNTHIMLFLNKHDLFKKKIETIDLNVAFQDYDGGCSSDNAQKYITQKFLDVNKHDQDRIHVFYTCATDRKNVEDNFVEVKDLIKKENLFKNPSS